MTALYQIVFYLKLTWKWVIRGLSADFSIPADANVTTQVRKMRQRYAPLATYVLEPTHTWSYAIEEMPAVPKKPVRPKPTGLAPGTTELFRQIIVCKKCGSTIDDNALTEACPVCHSVGVTVSECTCLHFPEMEWIAQNRTRQTLEEMSAKNPFCPFHTK